MIRVKSKHGCSSGMMSWTRFMDLFIGPTWALWELWTIGPYIGLIALLGLISPSAALCFHCCMHSIMNATFSESNHSSKRSPTPNYGPNINWTY